MGLCAQMIYYIMSDGSPEEVLAKIFRVFDVNRWQKHLNIGWTGFIFLLQNFLSYVIDCCSIDAFWWEQYAWKFPSNYSVMVQFAGHMGHGFLMRKTEEMDLIS